MRRALYFFPHNPHPPRSGAHKRSLEMLAGLAANGYEVVFASTTLSSETAWTDEGRHALLQRGATAVHVYDLDWADRLVVKAAPAFYGWTKTKPPISNLMLTPPGMRRWFRTLCRDLKPDVVILSYAFWDALLNNDIRRTAHCVVDILDLFTINSAMRNRILRQLPAGRLSAADVPDTILSESFFSGLSTPAVQEEYRIFDHYDCAIGISPHETDLVKANTHHAKVLYIPMSHEVVSVANTYAGPALFTTGPNPLNTQGYFYFAKKVLPQLRRMVPEFALTVTGSVCDWVTVEDGIRLAGFVADLKPLFETARFLICPVIGKTGQLIKIVEAMAHGVPVVALETAAVGSPIQHGVNGWVARDAAEFAGYCVQLWQDADLCRRMGAAARDSIARGYSRSKILGALGTLI